jgi:hypothetical protein
VLGGPGYNAPSDTLNFALIGCGGQGKTDAGELVMGGQNLVALVDVDFGFVDREVASRLKGRDGRPNEQMARLQEAYGKAKRYADFRKMLEQQKDVDAIVVATPDHTHAVIAKTAMEMGKHAYVEKPLTHSIHEARVLRETATRTKVVTQMGNMGHSSEGAALINEWAGAGVIGPVRDVHVWTNRPVGFWPQGVPRPGKFPVVADVPVQAGPNGGQAGGNMGRQGRDGGGGAGMQAGFGSEWTIKTVNKTLAATMDGNYPVPTGLEWISSSVQDRTLPTIRSTIRSTGAAGWIGDQQSEIWRPTWLTIHTGLSGLPIQRALRQRSRVGMDGKNQPVTYPLATQIVYKFPARGSQPPVAITWNDGGLMSPRPDILPEDVQLDRGVESSSLARRESSRAEPMEPIRSATRPHSWRLRRGAQDLQAR